ncbi:MAG: hypothetical protein Q9195_000568 [Heterodermia aff. obscurata]
MDMGSLRAELQLPHHFITGDDADDLDDDIMILGSTPQLGSTPKEWRAPTAPPPRPPPMRPPTPAQPAQPQPQQQRSFHLTQLAQQQGMLPPSQQPTPAAPQEQPGDFDDHMMGMSPENMFMPPRTAGQQFGRLSAGTPMNAMRAQPSWTSSSMIIHSSAM